jgi:hypothetical protein
VVRTSYKVDPQGVFRNALRDARSVVSDLTEPLEAIAKDFYRTEPPTFEKNASGGFPDLSPAYKRAKRREVGFVYPMLVRSGALRASMTSPTDPNAVKLILNKRTLFIGTRIKYASAVQSRRPFLFLGPEAKGIATDEQVGRLERWVGILMDHCIAVLDGKKRRAG